jgi:uncharacterized RDD family membrane protein YckC
MASDYALVLTGELLPGHAPETVWPQLAAYFRMEPEKLQELLARAPRAIKQDSDPEKLKPVQAGIAQAGAQSEICQTDERAALYLMLGDAPRGPVPRAFVEQRVRQGVWADAVSVAEVGSSQWKPYRELAATAPPPDASAASRWAPPKAPLVVTPTAGDGDWQTLPEGGAIHAGFWRRFAAYMLDYLIFLIPSSIPMLGILVSLFGRWLYYALMESSGWQATLGKRAMGIKVTDEHGQRISFGRASGRYFAGALSYIILWVGYMMAGWTGRKQGLHDLIASTFVVFKEVQPAHPRPARRPPMPWYGWVLNIVPPLLIPLGIGAAIALPAYQDYSARAQAMQAVIQVKPIELEISAQESCRAGTRPVREPLQKIEVGDVDGKCTIEATFSDAKTVSGPLRGQSLTFSQEADGDWNCSSDLPAKYLPTECRP